MTDLNLLEAFCETQQLEAKLAAGGLPESLWESYSAFANADGGYILLGVRENPDHSLSINGLADPEEMLAQFWAIMKDPRQVGVCILQPEDVRILQDDDEDKRIIVIHVPAATPLQKPVWIAPSVMEGTYRRTGEGDYRCSPEEIREMLDTQARLKQQG